MRHSPPLALLAALPAAPTVPTSTSGPLDANTNPPDAIAGVVLRRTTVGAAR